MKTDVRYSCWRSPWEKWACLAVSLLQLPLISHRVRDYRFVIETHIFSPEVLEVYRMTQEFHILIAVLCSAGFLGLFLAGELIHRRPVLKLIQGLMLLTAAVALTAGMLLLKQTEPQWILLACMIWMLCGISLRELWITAGANPRKSEYHQEEREETI